MQLCPPGYGVSLLSIATSTIGYSQTGDGGQVGHTGNYEAAVKAISETDKAVKTIYEACEEAGYILLVTSDHGNAEQMINPDTGNPHTAHTTNPVPFIMTADPVEYSFVQDVEGQEEGALCDVAPTVLVLMVRRLL